ncbi:MAG: tetratricopeptide repeat protein [Desulfovibrio sp.]|nr:tetratricopeptide repeat protein [Desulfovibrio sp.]
MNETNKLLCKDLQRKPLPRNRSRRALSAVSELFQASIAPEQFTNETSELLCKDLQRKPLPRNRSRRALSAVSELFQAPIALACFAAFFCLLLCPSAFSASHGNKPLPDEATTKTQDALPDVSSWGISPEAQRFFYYLALSQSLFDNTRTGVIWAINALISLDPSLPVFQDGAAILLSRGELEEAEKTALAGLERFPDNPLLCLLLSGVYNERAESGKAMALLEAALAKNPENREIQEELIRIYIRQGDNTKAAELLKILPETDTSPEAELFRAGVLSTVGRTGEAKELLRELLKKEPEYAEAWLELAYLEDRDKNLAAAVEAYEKAARLMPENKEVYLRIITLRLKEKKPDAAMRVLENAELNASQFIQAAMRFAGERHYQQAEALLKQAQEKGADADEVALFLSMIKQESSNDPKSWLAPLAGIKPQSPVYPAALEQKARIHLKSKDYENARKTAHAGRKLFPDRKDLWGIEAFALAKLKKAARSEAVLMEALRQYPGDEDLLFSLGNIQDEIGNKNAAMQTMEEIIALNPRNYQALNYIGYSLADMNVELDRALTLVTKALEQNPEADFIVDSLAWVLYRLGRHSEAWVNINRCISLGGDDAVIWEHYGDIALALGKKDEAAKGYKEAIQRQAANLKEVRRKLSKLDNSRKR